MEGLEARVDQKATSTTFHDFHTPTPESKHVYVSRRNASNISTSITIESATVSCAEQGASSGEGSEGGRRVSIRMSST